MMKALTTAAQRAALLPGGSSQLFVVLFWRSSEQGHPKTAMIRSVSAGVTWPACFRAVSVDLDSSPEIAQWFDLARVPMLAVVTDGAMLDMEYDCTPEACDKLADSGRSQYLMMRSMSA